MPLAIAPFQGRAMVGVGKLLRIYDMGKKKLLRKCENKVRQRSINHSFLIIACFLKRLYIHQCDNMEWCEPVQGVFPFVCFVCKKLIFVSLSVDRL